MTRVLPTVIQGGRDNVKTLVTKDTQIQLPSIALKAKAVPQDTDIVGHFTLAAKIPTHHVEAYEPIPFQITLEGEGYTPHIQDILPKDLNITHFGEKPIVAVKHSIEGTKSTIVYTMAFSHNTSFTLPKITLNAFDPKKDNSYVLEIPDQHFTVIPANPTALIDKQESPKPFSTDLSWIKTLFSYLIVFFSGYVSALFIKWKRKKQLSRADPLAEKIKQCKNEKTLFQLLISQKSKDFSNEITKLETQIYAEGNHSLKEIKHSALEKL